MKQQTYIFMSLLVCAAITGCLSSPLCAQTGLVINEIMGANSTILDEDGDSSDWIELYNGSNQPIHLKGYALSDKSDNIARWHFPERTIAPGEYLLVFASGKDRTGTSGSLHTNFKLSERDDEVCLLDTNGAPVSRLPIDRLPRDISYGLHPSTGRPAYFPAATPAQANTSPALSPTVKYSVQGGFYPTLISVKLHTDDDDTTIYYTTDGRTPTTASPVYSEPIQIDRNTTLRAISLKKGHLVGPPTGQAYFINFDNRGMAVVAISAEEKSIFDAQTGLFREMAYNDYMLREKVRAHISYFDENGRPGFSQDAIIAVVGASSRQIMIRPLKISASQTVDPMNGTFKYRLFADKEIEQYRHFQLRNNNQDGVRYISDPDCTPTMGIRNALFSELVRGQDGIEIRDDNGPVLLFINGKNCGMMNISEKRDNASINENNPSVKSGDVDLLVFRDDMGMRAGRDKLGKGAPFIREDGKVIYRGYFEDGALEYEEISESAKRGGSTKGIDDFLALDPTDPGMLDPKSYIATMAAHAIACNADFGMNNSAFWRSAPVGQEPGPFRALSFDFDSVFGLDRNKAADYEILLDYNERTKLFREFMKKEEYRSAFIRKVDEFLNGPFKPENALSVIERFKQKMEPWIEYHLDMWASGKMDKDRWEENIESLKRFISKRPKYIRLDLQQFFNFNGYSDMAFSVLPRGGGAIYIDSGVFRSRVEGSGTFANIPMNILAKPTAGYTFSHFIINGSRINEQDHTFAPENGINIEAVFVKDPMAPVADIAINEVVRSGQFKIADEDGERQDWIEIFNTTEHAIDLAGIHLTDNEAKLTKWTFPAVSIGPGEFILIFASGKNRNSPTGNLHANFKLSTEPILLVDKDGKTIIDSLTFQQIDGILKNNAGIRHPDGTATFIQSTVPTPGRANVCG